jgi:hypothetical protein
MARQKISNNVFQTWQIQYLHIELRNESQMTLLAGQNWDGDTRQSCHRWFVISPKLKRSSFTKWRKWRIAAKAANNSQSNVD